MDTTEGERLPRSQGKRGEGREGYPGNRRYRAICQRRYTLGDNYYAIVPETNTHLNSQSQHEHQHSRRGVKGEGRRTQQCFEGELRVNALANPLKAGPNGDSVRQPHDHARRVKLSAKTCLHFPLPLALPVIEP